LTTCVLDLESRLGWPCVNAMLRSRCARLQRTAIGLPVGKG